MWDESDENDIDTDKRQFPVGAPTVHHLVPKQKYRDRWEDAPTASLCSRCHKQIHRLFENNTLDGDHDTVESCARTPSVGKLSRG